MFFDLLQSGRKIDATIRQLPPYVDNGWRPPSYFPNLQDAVVIGIDTETKETDFDHGPGWSRNEGHIIGVSIAAILRNGERGKWYFPVRHEVERQDNLDPAQVFDWLRVQLNTPNIPKVVANGVYDYGWLSTENIYPQGQIYDVQFAEALIDESANVALDTLGMKYLRRGKTTDECKEWIFKAYPKANANNWRGFLWRSPPKLAGPYGEDDADMPLDIIARQWPIMSTEGTLDLFRMECDQIPLLVRMRMQGVPVSIPHYERLRDELTLETAQLYSALSHKVGGVIDNVTAPSQLAKAFDAAGIQYPRTAPTKNAPNGNPSFRKEWLKLLSDDAIRDPTGIGKLVNEIREREKLCSTFIDGYILGRARIDSGASGLGRIYCSFHPLRGDDGGAKTGRYSSSDPNLQNIPARTKLGKRMRDGFVAEYGHCGYHKKDYCVAPDTRILTSDMQHIPAHTVRVGMELVGFDRNGPNRMLRPTLVTAITTLRQPCYRITTNRGSVVSSALHKWLRNRGGNPFTMVETRDIGVGDRLPRVCHVWEPRHSFMDGWFGGILDGEGWKTARQMGFAQRPGYVLNRAYDYMRANNIVWAENYGGGADCVKLTIAGGRHELWRVLGMTYPVRLLRKTRDDLINQPLSSRWLTPDVVIKVEYVGEREVIGIETDATTLIADGLASSNSQIEYRLFAHYAVGARADEMRQRYISNPATDYHLDTQQDVAAMRGINLAAMSDEERALDRKPIKNVNFGLLYGQTEKSLAYKAGWSEAEAQQFFMAYHAGRPFVRTTMEAIMSEVQYQGYVSTLLGRRTRFDRWEPTKFGDRVYGADGSRMTFSHDEATRRFGAACRRAFAYKAVNYKFQGSAADVLKAALVRLYKEGVFDFIGYPKLLVHDEVDWSKISDSPNMQPAFDYAAHVMETTVQCRVPIKVDSSEGATWGACK